MIHLTRLNHLPLVLNADLIELIEVTPDTVISLTSGQKLVVLEPAEEVVRRVVEFRRAIYRGIPLNPSTSVDGLSGSPDDAVDGDGSRIGHGKDNRSGS
jgi:flagellar protein FlbD